MKKITYINSIGESVTFSHALPYLLQSIDANSLGVNAITSNSVGSDGQYTGEVTYNPRTIVCKLAFGGRNGNKHDYQAMQQRWQKICKILNPKLAGTLIYENNAGTYKIECRPQNVPNFATVAGATSTFDIDFIADNPLWKSFQTFGGGVFHIEGGLHFPLRFPIRYGTWEANLIAKNNTSTPLPIIVTGTIPAGTTIKIKNTSNYQALTQAKAGTQAIKFEFNSGTGQCYQTYSNGIKAFRNNLFTFNSDFDMRLDVGENILTLEYEGDRPEITIEYNKLYVGV